MPSRSTPPPPTLQKRDTIILVADKIQSSRVHTVPSNKIHKAVPSRVHTTVPSNRDHEKATGSLARGSKSELLLNNFNKKAAFEVQKRFNIEWSLNLALLHVDVIIGNVWAMHGHVQAMHGHAWAYTYCNMSHAMHLPCNMSHAMHCLYMPTSRQFRRLGIMKGSSS